MPPGKVGRLESQTQWKENLITPWPLRDRASNLSDQSFLPKGGDTDARFRAENVFWNKQCPCWKHVFPVRVTGAKCFIRAFVFGYRNKRTSSSNQTLNVVCPYNPLSEKELRLTKKKKKPAGSGVEWQVHYSQCPQNCNVATLNSGRSSMDCKIFDSYIFKATIYRTQNVSTAFKEKDYASSR